MPDLSEAKDVAESAANSRPMSWLARLGLAARGTVYLLMGALAVAVGLGGRAHVDQRGALTEAISRPFGGWVVALLALGFAGYAIWRLSEAVFGVTGEPDGAGPRLKSAVRGVGYAILALTAGSVLLGSRGSQSGQQGHLAGNVMATTGGRWLVGVVGAAVVVAGALMIHEGWSEKFMKYFGALPTRLRTWVVRLGQVGTTARGLAFALAGVLVVAAAWTADPKKAGGLDEAFKSLLDQPYGRYLVLALGAGLMVFGLYGLAEARWRRVIDQTA
jgi:hypothetical protein